jgi:hypothetical protein
LRDWEIDTGCQNVYNLYRLYRNYRDYRHPIEMENYNAQNLWQ